jgi:molybdate transport system permease protein
MSNAFFETIWLTLQLAGLTTLALLLIGIPIAYGLAHLKGFWKPVLTALVSLPLVLPPTVLGFYLLLAFSPENGFGRWLDTVLGIRLVFTFAGLVVASVVYSLPFMVQPLQTGFENVPNSLIEASYTLGKGKWETFRKVLLPLIRPALLTGIVLSFAHTIGEFGVVLMIGGNIPGETRVASIAIFDEVESLQYAQAHQYAWVLLLLSFLILVLVYAFNDKASRILQ